MNPLVAVHRSVARSIPRAIVMLLLLGPMMSATHAGDRKLGILPAAVASRDGIQLDSHSISSRTGWNGLVCSASTCEKVTLRVAKSPDDPAVVSISLQRKRKPAAGEMTVALLRGVRATDREVATYFTALTPRNLKDVASGSLGVTFATPTGAEYRVIPRWNDKTEDRWLTLYLEGAGQRQALGRISFATVAAGLKARDLVIWAGDVDGDGKIDLITHVGPDPESSAGLYLWLSSRAPRGRLVGLAASLAGWAKIEEAEGC